MCESGRVELDDTEFCPNCGAPIEVGGWVVVIGAPKAGAVLDDDGSCRDCGMPFVTDGGLEPGRPLV
jgi:RNA polymerase subunit RPABC4/transcription elongation factor Spt4